MDLLVLRILDCTNDQRPNISFVFVYWYRKDLLYSLPLMCDRQPHKFANGSSFMGLGGSTGLGGSVDLAQMDMRSLSAMVLVC